MKVQDNGSPSLSTNCFLNVAIEDENDNSPSFDYTDEFYQINIRPTITPDTRVYRVYATDEDAGENGRVVYSLSATIPNCPGCFNIERDSGWITRGRGSLQPNTKVCCRLFLFLAINYFVSLVKKKIWRGTALPNGLNMPQFYCRARSILITCFITSLIPNHYSTKPVSRCIFT